MKKGKIGYWNAQWKAFLSSFSNIFSKKFLKSALFDLLTIIAIILVVNVCLLIINSISIKAFPNLLNIYDLKDTNEQAFNDAVADYGPVLNKIFWWSLVIISLGSLILLFLISIFYGKAWCIGLKKKFNAKFLRKYYLLNLLWALFWLIILLLTINIFVTTAAAIILLIEMLLFFYLDPVLRAVFDEHKSILRNFADLFRIGKRIHWFVFFIISAFIIAFILMAIAGIINIPILFIIVLTVFILLFVGWMRNYIIELVSFMKN
jgi:hypothetical protein